MFKKFFLLLFVVILIPNASYADSYSRKMSGDMKFTQVKILTPWRSLGDVISPGIKVSQKTKGICSSASLVNPRPDAWRCNIENETLDPCFSNASGHSVACIKSPWDKTAVLITLMLPLPINKVNSENYLEQTPWGIELDNNLRCVSNHGSKTPTLAGMESNSICFNESSKITDIKFLDSFNQDLPTWLVFIKQEDLFLEQVPINTAWY
jgi:hypothetical protein